MPRSGEAAAACPGQLQLLSAQIWGNSPQGPDLGMALSYEINPIKYLT